jgi:N-acetylmuramoyl-L-alanine amidase
MARPPFKTGSALRSVLAWMGLILMALCLIWLESMPRIERPVSLERTTVPELFPVIVLDPGHGGQDSGAMCAGVLEKDLTLDIAQRVERRLRDEGFTILMTRTRDNYISLAERAALANSLKDCIFVSIHFNEGNKPVSSGVETYYAEHQVTDGSTVASWLPFLQRISVQTPNVESQRLAGLIQDALVMRTHALNRGTKTQQFYVLANVWHPAVLIEGGFISNKDDAVRLGTPDYREEMAAAINDGIMHYQDLLRNRRSGASPTTE